MRIYVISLGHAQERRQRMVQQAETLALSVEFMDATDGRFLTDRDRALVDDEQRRRITPYPLTDNEIACWLSHRRAMQMLIDSGEAMAVISEDDAILAPEFPAVIRAIEARAGRFDVIDLHRKFAKKEIFVSCRPLIPGFAMGRLGYTHMGAIAYVISREGARKFLASAPRAIHAIDKEMHRYWANGLDLYALEAPIALHDDEAHSFIDETRHLNRPKQRTQYPGADRLYWRLQRRWTRMADSVRKRMAFRGYVRKALRQSV